MLNKEQSELLIELKTAQTDQISKIESLSNYKQTAEREIEKKSHLLRNSEHGRKNATEMLDNLRYQVQD